MLVTAFPPSFSLFLYLSGLPQTLEETLRIEKARLERESYLLRMELDLLKKVQELERGDR